MARNEILFEAICNGNRKKVAETIQYEIEQNTAVNELLNDSMIPAMRAVGEQFTRNEIFVPEMLIAARAMQTGLDLINPLLDATGHKTLGKIAVGTVKGDLHDIGKNLVAMMVKGAGYEVIDLGIDCDVEKYEAAVKDGAQIIMLSALLTTTMPYMKEVVDFMKSKGLPVKVLIGGAPVTQEYADQIGADGYSRDANEAVTAVEKTMATI